MLPSRTGHLKNETDQAVPGENENTSAGPDHIGQNVEQIEPALTLSGKILSGPDHLTGVGKIQHSGLFQLVS